MSSDYITEPSASPWLSPVTLVPKGSNEVRFCIDFRKLNDVTKKDRYPLPIIKKKFDTLTGSAIFSTIDLKAGYWQIPVAPNSIENTTFICHRGLFQFKRMPFGLANAPSNFQRTMNCVLSDLICECAMCYIDDVVIFLKTPEDHAYHLEQVFERLAQAGLKLRMSICDFAKPKVKLLGYVVNLILLNVLRPLFCALTLGRLNWVGYVVNKDGIKTIPQTYLPSKNYNLPQTLVKSAVF